MLTPREREIRIRMTQPEAIEEIKRQATAYGLPALSDADLADLARHGIYTALVDMDHPRFAALVVLMAQRLDERKEQP